SSGVVEMSGGGPRVMRLLDLADDDARGAQSAILRAFRLFLLFHVATRTWFWFLREPHDDTAFRVTLAALLTLCALLAVRPGWQRRATVAALAVLACKLVDSFPSTSNHFFIEILCVALLAAFDLESGEERALCLVTLRWVVVLVLFWTGLQKVLYGTYFDGQFLGFSIATRASFADLFQWILPAAEIDRLRGLRPIGVGSGPFAFQSPLGWLVSNGVYVFEIVAPALLLVRRTRPWAAVAVIAFTALIEIGAREFLFGALFVNLLLLFFARPVNRALLPAFALFYVWMIGVRLGWLPTVAFN
ncbi:MAG: hypothetical protein ACRERC_04560, partial [Candidatus Binatia bacterium]